MDFKHLILLVGTNPLPSYIVADYYLHKNPYIEEIWLVHSEKTNFQDGTYVYAENLKKAIEKNLIIGRSSPVSFSFVPLSNVSNAKEISRDIYKLLIQNLSEDSSVHLNYTGGTKVMGTHIYLTLEKALKILKKSYSYLDARTFSIIDDAEGCITSDLRDSVKLAFKDLIYMHEFERKNIDSSNDFGLVTEKFRKIIGAGCLQEYFNAGAGYDRTLFENMHKKGELAEKVKQINRVKIEAYKPNQVFKGILDSFPPGCNLINDICTINDSNFKRAVRFLDGEWFERFIYCLLKEKLNMPNAEILFDWKIKKKNWKTDFQLDVILVKGYQLIGISCTTSRSKPICKSKGFEIIQRSRQIGGDEARAILFTLLDTYNKTELQNELMEDTGGAMSNILVFGFNDINDEYIIDKIKDFIK